MDVLSCSVLEAPTSLRNVFQVVQGRLGDVACGGIS